MTPDVSSSHINIRLIATVNERSRRAFLEHTQLQKSMYTRSSNKELPTFIFDHSTNAPFTLSKNQNPETILNLSNTMNVILEIEETIHTKSIPLADDLHESLQSKTHRIACCLKIYNRFLRV